MSCGSKQVATVRNAHVPSSFVLKKLEERGRLQFFFHSPSSKLPVRDVRNEQRRGAKTEPHLEEAAENYCARCYQRNSIVPFLRSDEKYLFLFTTAKRRERRYRNKRFIVGYIVKRKAIRRTDGTKKWWAVSGPTKMYYFKDAVPLASLIRNPMKIRVLGLDPERTAKVLQRLRKGRNILRKCLAELKRLRRQPNKSHQRKRTCK